MTTFTKSTVIYTIICLFFSNIILAQTPNSEFFQLATSNSTYDWLTIRPEFQLSVEEFLERKTALGLSSNDNFLLLQTKTDELGKTHYRYQQTHSGIPVAHAQLLVHTSKEGYVETSNGHLIRGIEASPVPTISNLGALSTALNYMNAEEYAWQNEAYQRLIKEVKNDPNATFFPKGELQWASKGFSDRSPKNYQLTYQLEVYATRPSKYLSLYVDAQNGEIINEVSKIYDVIEDSLATGETNYACVETVEFTTTYHPDNEASYFTLENDIVKTYDGEFGTSIFDGNNEWTNNNSAVDVHWGMEQTHSYFLNKHNRNSLDDDGISIIGIIDAFDNCNASWNSAIPSALFGDGNPYCNNNTPTSLDIVGHELTHGIIQYSANLIYQKESGALNESFSDIFGVLVHFESDPECADWIIGDEVFTFTSGIRNLSNPKTFNAPDTYQGQYWEDTQNCNESPSNDYCGVHTNSSVQNYWFYLLAEGGNGINDNGDAYSIIGIGKAKAAKVAYRNLTIYLGPTSDYLDARSGSIQATNDLYGLNSIEVQTVLDAWCAVGVGDGNNCTVIASTLSLQSPNGGEIWKAGTMDTIQWEGGEDINSLNIRYSLDGGFNWYPIISNTVNDSSFAWQIPDTLNTNLAKIRIEDASNIVVQDESDAIFTIEPCDVVADFSKDVETVTLGTMVQFSNNSSNATHYEWLIDGHLLSTSTDFSHTFNEKGSFLVHLIAMDEKGCSNDFCITVLIDEYLATGISSYACSNPVEFHTTPKNNKYVLRNSLGPGIKTYEPDEIGPDGDIVSFLSLSDSDNHWTDDPTVVSIQWAMEQTYLYFLKEHSLKGLGNENDEIVGVAYAYDDCNADWDSYRARFGTGGGNSLVDCHPVTSADIVAHELTHRVIDHSADLIYAKESGALNESFSDIFGTLVHFEADPECANWIMGDEVKTINNAPLGFRDLSNPKNLNSPNYYEGQYWENLNGCNPSPTENDYCGVHTNSGVHNYWFYLLTEGSNGEKTNEAAYTYEIQGLGKEKSAKIAYLTLTNYLTPTSTYADAKWGSIQATKELYGSESQELQTVVDAWCAVGLGNENCTILHASLEILSPNGGELWKAGTSQAISWTSEGEINKVNLQYSIEGGVNWHTIISNVSNTAENSFTWDIPEELASNLVKIRVVNSDDISIKDESDAVFTIEACNIDALFTADTYSICAGQNQSIDFTNQSTNATNFQWEIDGELIEETTDFSYTFNEEGTFLVNLMATDEEGCTDHFYQTIEVSNGPDSTFYHQITGLSIAFVAADLGADSYNWDFGDGNVGSGVNPTHTYTALGDYIVELTIGDGCGSNIGSQIIGLNNCLVLDSLQLVDFYYATGGDGWTDNSGWLENPVSEWFGVTLSGDGCSVEKLELFIDIVIGNNLVGTLPDLNLPNLEVLTLHDNKLYGGIPNFSTLTKLSDLDLSYNKLSGNIPDFSNLTNLSSLNLEGNSLSGAIPNFSSLNNLSELDLSGNHLNDIIPNFNNLPKLSDLDFRYNKLSGNIPDFNDLVNLSELYLTRNQLNGIIPNFNLPNLSRLYLNENQLNGNIPDFNLPNLSSLYLNDNQLNGTISNFNLPNLSRLYLNDNQLNGTIPNFNLPNLLELYLNDNQLNGVIPNFNLPNLSELYLSENKLDGTIPNFNLTDLTHLYLDNNQLTGVIPNLNLPKLSRLYLNNNQLTFAGTEQNINYYNATPIFTSFEYNAQATIPIHQEAESLYVLAGGNLANNTYWWYELGNPIAIDMIEADSTFVIPPNSTASYYCKVTNSIAAELTLTSHLFSSTYIPPTNCLTTDSLALVELFLATGGTNWNNNDGWLVSPIDEWFGVIVSDCTISSVSLGNNNLAGFLPDLNLPNLSELRLYSNQLTGSIPDFNNLPNLLYLHLGNNQLSGTIPDFSNLSNLSELRLYSNQLSGMIPNFNNLPNLSYLGLSSNQISGTTPNFSKLPNLSELHLGNNQLSGTIPNFNNLSNLSELHLSSNQLSDTIPNFNNLPNLSELHLGNNQLSGTIPNFSNLPNLSYLYLSSNQLNETIPDFNNLSNLSNLYLSTNQLSGTIPNFSNLPNLSYLNLSTNQLNGTIPDFSNLPELSSLVLGFNQLSGEIPDFSSLSKLSYLSLRYNQLSGLIPDFSNLPNLSNIGLESNYLNGLIPDFSNLHNLSALNLSRNQLSEPIPNFSNLPNLSSLYLFESQLNDEVPIFSNLPNLAYLFLYRNQLTFDGLEQNVTYSNNSPTFNYFSYSPQSTIPTHQFNNQLYVSAGGTYENNTYTWYEEGNPTPLVTPNDSIFTVTDFSKSYYCQITNSIATELTLISEPISIDPTSTCSTTANFDIPIICAGEPTTFTNTSTNATTFHWQITNTNVSSNTEHFSHTFSTAGTYELSLTVSDGGTCQDIVVKNVEVYSNVLEEDLEIQGEQYLCENSSLLAANISGMMDYDWYLDGTKVGSQLTHIAHTTGEYVLQVTDYCGNQQSDTLLVILDNNCVRAGDYNYDGIVNHQDLLPFGVHMGATGPARPNASLSWVPQPCENWSGTTESGNNLKHVDGNGNGLIEDNDTTAIFQNYGNTHEDTPGSNNDSDSPFKLSYESKDAYPYLNSNDTLVQPYAFDLEQKNGGSVTAYGLAFSITYNFSSALTVYGVKLNSDNSWLGDNTTNLKTLMHHDVGAKKIDVALTRTNHINQDKTDNPEFLLLEFLLDNAASGDDLQATITPENIQMSLSNGNLMTVSGNSKSFGISFPSCLDSLVVNYTAASFIPTVTQGPATIQVGNLDGNGSIVFPHGKRTYLQAEQHILLEAGTDLQLGTIFGANIDSCQTEIEGGKQALEENTLFSTNDTDIQFAIAPNPFTERIIIDYWLPANSPVTVIIYDIHGRVVKRLVQNKAQKAGQHTIGYEPCNSNMSTGIYLCEIKVGEWQKTIKLVKSN